MSDILQDAYISYMGGVYDEALPDAEKSTKPCVEDLTAAILRIPNHDVGSYAENGARTAKGR